MSKKYYYTDAIVALYMMKEFRVKIEKFNLHDLFIDIETRFLSEFGIAYGHGEEYKIYVTKKSKHIFEPKKGDNDKNGLFFDGRHWTDGISYAISSERSKTSFRFDKQFFMPEVEND